MKVVIKVQKKIKESYRKRMIINLKRKKKKKKKKKAENILIEEK